MDEVRAFGPGTFPSQRAEHAPVSGNLLFAADFTNAEGGRAISMSFQDLGFEVREVDIGQFIPRWRSIPLKLVRRALYGEVWREYTDAIVAELRETKFDLLLTAKGAFVQRRAYAIARDLGVKTAVYYPDFHFDYPGVKLDLLLDVDHFISTKSFHLPYLKPHRRTTRGNVIVPNLHLVHHGYVDRVHSPYPGNPAESYDVVYIGNWTEYKAEFFATLKKLIPDRSFAIFGNGWNRSRYYSTLQPCVQGQRKGREYCRCIAAGKIIVALHMGPAGSEGFADLVSARTFEIPACGGFMLHIDNAEVRSLYDVPNEIDVFSDTHDLAEKIYYYLARPDLRRLMSERALRRARPNYGYGRRVSEILDIVGLTKSKALDAP